MIVCDLSFKFRRGYQLLAVVFAVALSSAACAEEGGWRTLWPFGKDAQTAEQEEQLPSGLVLGDPALEAELGEAEAEQDSWMVESPIARASWPEIKMPKLEFASPWRKENGEAGWLAKPIHKARDGAHNALERTRSAMNNSIDKMKGMLPGGDDGSLDDSSQLAAGSDEPGFFSRMFGPKESAPVDEGVRMAQEGAELQR
ncbi:hypothetical protein NG895_26725 [Aeoliella sp. ICT_H6.2]|uniref:Uncharacterized protein n=1 Tax=Aeoliella straminimaris TaxID=2954799 RepID=A0A9X2FF20_9BACT|nr:hypothetical protein [Aeoliella straminimaris]MCO6047514.1 hypothetical protein [Aeoliella straminimaris]